MAKTSNRPPVTKIGELKISTFAIPAADFDPLTATPRQLRQFGIPLRPDPADAPDRHERWARHFGRPMKYIVPKFRPIAGRTHIPLQNFKPTAGTSNATFLNWSGAICSAAESESFFAVEGSWIVPDLNSGPVDNTFSCAWIGIDGTNGLANLLQAGTEHNVAGSTHQNYAWWEWLPGYVSEVQITNLKVYPGDTMFCSIARLAVSEATIMMQNYTKQTSVMFNVKAPKGTSLTGQTAEWILERPANSKTKKLFTLARYGSTVFTETAALSHGSVSTASDGSAVDMTDDSNHVISKASIYTAVGSSDSAVRTTYMGS